MKRSLLCQFALVLMLASAGPLAAQGGLGAGVRVPGRPAPVRRALDLLGLTPQQKRQLNLMRRGRNAEQSRLNSDIRARRSELADMYRSYFLDPARADMLIQQIAGMEAQRMRLQLQDQVELRRILTREQFARFSQILQSSRSPAFQPSVRPAHS